MTIIKPFKGYRYNPKAAGKLSRLITPPYDVISREQQEGYYRSSPYNFIRLDLGKVFAGDNRRDNRYTRSGRVLEEWLAKGILEKESEDSVYVYSQQYRIGGKVKDRMGFISLARLEEDRTKGFLPHEKTFKGPKADRLELMKETRANLSPVFSIVFDEDRKILNILRKAACSSRPVIDTVFEGTRNRIWRITDQRTIKTLSGLMSRKKALIADGHHRYEVALEYRRFRQAAARKAGPAACDYLMMYFAPSDPGGLSILPTHRMVEGLAASAVLKNLEKVSGYFDIIRVNGRKQMESLIGSGGRHIIGAYLGGKNYLCLKLKRSDASGLIDSGNSSYWRNLDVVILHHLVFEKALGLKGKKAEEAITFTRDPETAFRWAASKAKRAAFFLKPPELKDIYNIVRCRERMPHKTTYFYPKPPSGLLINRFE
ncbi:MAG: DUF1015 domain-containing protein [Candidatus Omnitrophota bacterium]